MIVWWPTFTQPDYPTPADVRAGVAYAYGSLVGTYNPTAAWSVNSDDVELPDVSGAMFNWFQKVVFTLITKTVENYQDVETATEINFLGVWQVFNSQKLLLKPEGQRQWKWFTVHAEPNLTLSPDDIVLYQGTKYRVKEKLDYTRYGYVEYHLIEDFVGAGPVP